MTHDLSITKVISGVMAHSVIIQIYQELCRSQDTGPVLPRLVDSLVVRLRLCWERPGPAPGAWPCVWGGGEDEMEAWDPILLP